MLLDMQLVPLGRDRKGTPIIRTNRHAWLEAHDGDISVCANCSGLSVFQGHELRLPTPAELARSMRDKKLRHTIKELRAEQYGWSVF